MEKSIFKLIISLSALILTLLSIVFITMAWYTNTISIGKLDAETKDVSIIYKFNDEEEYNKLEYSITNLAFFDIDNYYDSVTKTGEDELKYLNNMVVHLELNLENYSTDDVEYSVTFNSEVKEVIENSDTVSLAYVQGIISNEEISFEKTNDKYMISHYLPDADANSNSVRDYNEITGQLTKTGAGKSTVIHIYLFGVQEIDSASNDLFINDSYIFSLTINSIGLSDNPDIVVN